MTVVTFHCDREGGDYYAKAAEKLRLRLAEFGVEALIEKIDYPGSWLAACRYKPVFLAEKLIALNKPILWVDVDLEIHSRPALPFGEWDVALVPSNNNHGHYAGVIGLRPTQKAFDFLNRWHFFCDVLKRGDHSAMAATIRDMGLSVYDLPREYCKMNGTADDSVMSFKPSMQGGEK